MAALRTGAWIEGSWIGIAVSRSSPLHPVWGAWIEGLRYKSKSSSCNGLHPVWGAWIEGALALQLGFFNVQVAPRMGAWIEGIVLLQYAALASALHPVWGAWIKGLNPKSTRIAGRKSCTPYGVHGLKGEDFQPCSEEVQVAPHTGCVD